MNIDLDKIFKGKSYEEEQGISLRPISTPRWARHNSKLPTAKNFENEVWRLFYNMGCIVNSNNEQLIFDLSSYVAQDTDLNQDKREIDNFFIMRDGYVFFVECKTAKKSTGYQFNKKHLNNLKSFRKSLRKRLQKIFGVLANSFKVIHVVATKGYEWKQQAIDDLLNQDFILLREQEISYFSQCYENSKNNWFTFNQFLSFFRSGKNDFKNKNYKGNVGFRTLYQSSAPSLKIIDSNEVDDEQIEENIISSESKTKKNRYAYTISMTVGDALRISTVAHKKADDIYSLGNATKNFYQRILKSSRLSRKTGIPSFIEEKNQPFINNLLINYKGDHSLESQWEKKESEGEARGGILKFKKLSPGMFHLIDGQHRLFGYSPLIEEDLNSKFKDHELIFTIFDNLPPQEEAKLFLDINQNQKGIDASLFLEVQSIFGADGDNDLVLSNLATAVVHNLQEETSKNQKIKSPFWSPKAIKRSENIRMKDSTGQNIKQGSLTIMGLVGEMKKSPLLSKHNNDFKSGVGFKKKRTDKDDQDVFNTTSQNLYEIYSSYFSAIKKAKPSFFETKDKKGRKVSNTQRIAQNIPAGGFLNLLDILVINNVTKKNMDVTTAINKDVNTLVKGLKSLSKDAEEQLFEGKTYGAAGPGNFSLELIEKFFPNYIDGNIKKRIEKAKEHHKRMMEPKLSQMKKDYEDSLKKIRNAKDTASQVQEIESLIRANINEIMSKIFNDDYWHAAGRRSFIDEHFFELKKIAQDRRNQIEKKHQKLGLDTKADTSWAHSHEIDYLQWKDWIDLLKELNNGAQKYKTYIQPGCLTAYNDDLRKLIRELFFASTKKAAKQCSFAEGTQWMDNYDLIRGDPSHPKKGKTIITKQLNDFHKKIYKNILKKLENIKKFLVN